LSRSTSSSPLWRVRFPAFAAILLMVFLQACGSDDGTGPTGPVDPADLEFAGILGINLAQMTKTASGLYYLDSVLGEGAEATDDATVIVHYDGWLHNGTKFDSSRDRGQPDTFDLSQLIQGWREGVSGMRVGGRRKLVMPSSLAYGATGAGGGAIPPFATLVFDVELLGLGG
jgi:FKBP-type peptidyl-prolyl cis-trans isomerase FkpA